MRPLSTQLRSSASLPPEIVILPDWYKTYPPIAGRPTRVVRNPRPVRRMSTRGFVEPSYEGKLSLMMVVPLDIFYEVLLAPVSTSNQSLVLQFLFSAPADRRVFWC